MRETHSDTEISHLTSPGVLGFYTHVEVTEIFLVRDADRLAHNVLSILVAEEHITSPAPAPKYLGGRIRLSSLKGMMFGIKRSFHPLPVLIQRVRHYRHTAEWQVSDQPLHVGTLTPITAQFVPADSTDLAPLNRLLKNNFWSGSHVLEMMDTGKELLSPLFERPTRLQELSVEVQKQLPLNLASLSDRLGNIVIQLPVTVLVASFGQHRLTGGAAVAVRWHPQASPRPLIASCEKQFDNVITGYASRITQAQEISLDIADGMGMQRGILWDDEHQVILAATEQTAFLNTISMDMHVSDPEPRVFTITTVDGSERQVRVALSDISESLIEAPTTDRGQEWIRKRVYREEADRLAVQRRFVQYRPSPGQKEASHEKALSDIRLLLAQHGKRGAWLWDPYLSADDILHTLFHCSHKNAELRALTAAYERPPASRARPTLASIARQVREWFRNTFGNPPPEPSFAEKQRLVLTLCKSNYRGLRLEYRMRSGQAGWSFHDRFLIFPNTDNGPLAWSLGSSVNSLGRQHHILQQVDDARLVADAFEELWNQLRLPEHLIWKTP